MRNRFPVFSAGLEGRACFLDLADPPSDRTTTIHRTDNPALRYDAIRITRLLFAAHSRVPLNLGDVAASEKVPDTFSSLRT